ncbi:hypothetical protein [Prescottella equi]
MAEIPARSAGPTRASLTALTCTNPTTGTEGPVAERKPSTSLRTLPAPGPLADFLPHHGLVRGSTVQVTGASSLQAGLIAAVTGAGGWAAMIGTPGLGLLAAVEMGAELRRCAVVNDVGASDPVEVAAVLVDGIDLVVLSLAGANVSLSRARAITARTRKNDAVLVVTEGRWPTVDLHLDARVVGYTGLGEGYGRITGVSLDLAATVRGRQPRRARIHIGGGQGVVSWTTVDHGVTQGALKVAR